MAQARLLIPPTHKTLLSESQAVSHSPQRCTAPSPCSHACCSMTRALGLSQGSHTSRGDRKDANPPQSSANAPSASAGIGELPAALPKVTVRLVLALPCWWKRGWVCASRCSRGQGVMVYSSSSSKLQDQRTTRLPLHQCDSTIVIPRSINCYLPLCQCHVVRRTELRS